MSSPYKMKVLEAYVDVRSFAPKNLSEHQNWLDQATNPPIAVIIEDVIDSLRNKEPEYEPLLFDYYLGEAAEALDRCLALRREIQEIEVLAISYARQYVRFKETSSVDIELDHKENLIKQAKNLQQGFKVATELFKSDTDSQIATALKKQSEVISISHGESATELERREQLTSQRWRVLQNIDFAEQEQHRTPGNALNFAERRDRLLALIHRDLSEAFKKLIAIAEGIKVTYGPLAPTNPLPIASEDNVLDHLITWIRDTIDFLEIQREREVDFDLVVPLVQASKDRTGANLTVGSSKAPFTDGSNGLFTINLRPWLDKIFGEYSAGKPRISALRLRAIGASISTDLSEDKDVRSSVWNLVIFPPTIVRSLNANMDVWQTRPPIILGDVRPTSDGRAVTYESGTSVRNQQLYGEWKVRVLPNIVTGTANSKDRTNIPVTDVKLHIRAVGIPINDPLAW